MLTGKHNVHVELTLALIERGVSISQLDGTGSPLYHAVKYNHLSVVVEILDRLDAQLVYHQATPSSSLKLAIDHGNKRMVELLLKHRVSIDTISDGNLIAYARDKKCYDVATLLNHVAYPYWRSVSLYAVPLAIASACVAYSVVHRYVINDESQKRLNFCWQ